MKALDMEVVIASAVLIADSHLDQRIHEGHENHQVLENRVLFQ